MNFITANIFTCHVTPKVAQFFDKADKKVVRIKAGGVPITEFVGLSSKINSYIREDHKGGKTARGIKKNVITKHIKHNDYKNTIFNNEQIYNRIKSIRSKNHQLSSYELKKVSLSCIDDKHNATKHRTKIF